MIPFPVHSGDTAAEASQPILAAVRKKFGFVPNLIRVLAEAPATAEACTTVMDIFERSSLSDAKLDALAVLTRSVAETRGWPAEAAKAGFFEAGDGPREYLEVIVGVALKTMSNYVNHAADTPLDPAFEAHKWAA